MSIKEIINNDIKDAMRAKDKERLGALRLISAAIKQIEVDERIEVDDQRLLTILSKLAKQRKESIQQYKLAKRDDLVTQEQFELNLIAHYLPAPLSTEEIEKLILQAIDSVGAKSMADMGKVMATLRPSLQGQADMSQVSDLIKNKLQAK